MNDIVLKLFILFLVSTNGILLLKQHSFNKNYTFHNDLTELKERYSRYEELFGLYIENREKFYAKGREYIMNRKGKSYNNKNVKTFQDKLNYLLIYESPENKTKIVDKILLRNYSEKIIGKDICSPILKIYNNIDDINLDELPEKFVLKCNHGSAMNIFCENKSKFNLSKAKNTLKNWIHINYGLLSFEYQYLNINRKVFAEQFLGSEIINYKFSCFNGDPKFIRVKGKINGTKLYNIYHINWTISNIEIKDRNYILTNNFKKPINLNKMIKYSKLLSSGFCYCRVDFYEVNDKLYLSEITFTPFNSKFNFKSKENSLYLGKLINISHIKTKNYI